MLIVSFSLLVVVDPPKPLLHVDDPLKPLLHVDDFQYG
jgi:hypothetical protein